jgi:TatD DNase family protein
MLIDSHTHFYDELLLPDAEEAIGRALEAGVVKMVQADVDSHEREAMWAIGKAHEGVLFQMLGLYPGSVDQGWREEMDALEKWKGHPVVAVGEIGLDYHEGKQFAAEQKEVFRLQLEMAAKMDLPVNIHLRDAWEDFLNVLSAYSHLGLRGNLHCFSGSWEIFLRANRYGDFSVGIGGVVTFKNASLAETIKKIPMEKILLETDCPYLAPVPYRGKRCESAYIPVIAAKIASQKGATLEEVEAVTTDNALKMFKL